MWTRETYDSLSQNLPFDILVIWDESPSMAKYGHVNTLLLALTALHDRDFHLMGPDRDELSILTITPLRRKITDRSKRWFSIIGLPGVKPLVLAERNDLVLELYFNYHFYFETKTTFKQYFPGAALSIRARNFLTGSFVPSPGSWGSDITTLTWDWSGTLIVEAGVDGVPSSIRKNFRGFKYLPSPFKIFICARVLSKPEEHYIHNNGFDVCSDADNPSLDSVLESKLDEFLRKQRERIKH